MGSKGSKAPEGYSEAQVQQMLRTKEAEKHAALMQSQLDAQRAASREKDNQIQAFMQKMSEDAKNNRAMNEQLLAKQRQQMETQRAHEQQKVQELETRMKDMARIAEIAKTDLDKAAKEGAALSSKIANLEQERLDWKKAEEEKTQKLMKETPPPFALKVDPPKNSPLYSEEYPCFAVMGRNGTGKSSLINAITGGSTQKPDGQPPVKRQKTEARHLAVGALIETTMGEPAPVFTKISGGTTIALFDRPGHGTKAAAKAGSTPDFIKDQGLKWWTGVILLTDRSNVPEEALIFQLCKSVGTPVVVARNKIVEDLQKEKEEKDFTGEEYSEEKCINQIRDHLDEIQMDGQAALMVDAHHKDKYQFNDLLAWLEKLSKK